MSNVATLAVVEGQLSPITAAPELIGKQFTAQAAINLFAEFTTAVNSAAGAQCQAFQSFAQQSRNATAEEVRLALSGVVESTRITVDNKREDTDATPMARKFQSMARAVWGAVRFGGISLDLVSSYSNSQSLYDDCRTALKEHGIDWKGLTDGEKAADQAKKATKAAMKEVLSEEGDDDALTLTPEQFTALKAKAKVKLAEKQAKAKLESMEKRAEKLAKDLIASYGVDDAEMVLKMAIERIGLSVFA
jgi:hypothetical protein